MRGLTSRVLVSKYGHRTPGVAPPEVPAPNSVGRILAAFKSGVRARSFGLTPYSYEHFVETRGRKKKVYEAALEAMSRRGLQPRDHKLSTFVKAEKLNLTAKPDPDARVIQPRTPLYNIALGVYISPLEHILYDIVTDMFGEKTIMKGMNAKQQGEVIARKWFALEDPVSTSFDVHRMDQHISRQLLQYEHSLYHLFVHSRKFRRLLRRQLRNAGKGYCWDGMVKYIVEGRRCSGDMNTGLGNCLIMCAIVYSALYQAPRNTWSLGNNGDDCFLFCNERDRVRYVNRIRAVLDLCCLPTDFEDPVYELEKLTFCQCNPVTDGKQWFMVRDPRVCLDKDACTIKPVRSKRSWDTLRNSVGMSGQAAADNMPIFKEFYAALRRGAGSRVDRDLVEDGLKRLGKGMNLTGHPITDEARVSFFRAFDITPSEQLIVEEHYRRLQPEWREPRAHRMTDSEGDIRSVIGCVG